MKLSLVAAMAKKTKNSEVKTLDTEVDTPAVQAKKKVNPVSEIQDYTTTVTILESITDAIFILSAKGKIEYANRSAQDYLQLPLEKIIGLNLGDFISFTDDETSQILNRNNHTELPISKIDENTFSNSEATLHGVRESVPVLINFSVIPDATGQLNYIIVTAKEIGYRRSLEKELRNRQALSVSFDRLKSLGEMSVGLVHTLGQPVTSMGLRLDYMSRMNNLDHIQGQVSELRTDLAQLSRIVDKVRSYAQSMANKQNKPIEINRAIHSVLSVLEYDLKAAGVSIHLDLAESMPLIAANEPELEQVIMNLLANASQAFISNETGGDRNVTVTTKAVQNKWIQVGILDNAGGIPETVAPQIFEPFFSTWEETRHAGTGLSVARSIVSSLGGDLNYRPGEEGSNFEFRIPIIAQEERTQLFNLIELLNSQ